MAKRKQESNALLDAMDLYQTLDDRDKATFLNWIGRQTTIETKPAELKLRGKKAAGLPKTGSAGSVGEIQTDGKPRYVPICVTCGNEKDYIDHSKPSPNYHKFEAAAEKSAVKATSKYADAAVAKGITLPDVPEDYASELTSSKKAGV